MKSGRQLSEISQSMDREILTCGNEYCYLELSDMAALHSREYTCACFDWPLTLD